jgi:hypothetical protein
MIQKLKLQLLEEKFVISKMPQFAELPSVFARGEMCFVMRTDEDLTIVSPEWDIALYESPEKHRQHRWVLLRHLSNRSPKQESVFFPSRRFTPPTFF